MSDMSDTVKQLIEQNRDEQNRRHEETNKRLDRMDETLQSINNTLTRFLVVDEKVTGIESEQAHLKKTVASLKEASNISEYRRTWTDKIVQSITASACFSVIAASLKVLGAF